MLHKKLGCFQDLLRMSKQELQRGIWRISPAFIKTTANFLPTAAQQHKLLPDACWNRYRELFVCAGLAKGSGGISIGHESVAFLAESRGLAGAGASKIFVWSPKTMTLLRDSLDEVFDEPRESTPNVRFRHIAGPWYLELDVDRFQQGTS